MDSVIHKLDAKILRVGKIGDVHNFFCEVPSDGHRRFILSIGVKAISHAHTLALVSLIQTGDQVVFEYAADVLPEHGVCAVKRLSTVLNKNWMPDPPGYGNS